jgi:hypothetical protein
VRAKRRTGARSTRRWRFLMNRRPMQGREDDIADYDSAVCALTKVDAGLPPLTPVDRNRECAERTQIMGRGMSDAEEDLVVTRASCPCERCQHGRDVRVTPNVSLNLLCPKTSSVPARNVAQRHATWREVRDGGEARRRDRAARGSRDSSRNVAVCPRCPCASKNAERTQFSEFACSCRQGRRLQHGLAHVAARCARPIAPPRDFRASFIGGLGDTVSLRRGGRN